MIKYMEMQSFVENFLKKLLDQKNKIILQKT